MSKAKYIAKSVDSSGNLAIAIADGSVGVYANTGISNAASASLYANTAIANAASASLYANTGISTATQTALNLKANQSTTYTKTEADAAISNLVAAAPGALDTLNELATALGNDPNFATTVTNSIALKSPLASPTLTGTATASNLAYTGTLTGSTGILNIGSGQVYKDASGNVGIGTSSPSAKLEVTGNLFFTSPSTAARYVALADVASGTGSLILQAGAGSAGYGGAITLYSHSHATYPGSVYLGTSASSGGSLIFGIGNAISPVGVERMRIDSSGNVGIGLTSPILNSVLSIAQRNSTGNGSNTLTLDHYYANNKYIQFSWYGTNIGSISQASGTFIVIDSPALAFQTGSIDRMRIDSSGNVGIGTSSPSSITGFTKIVQVSDAVSATYVVGGGGVTSEFGCSSNGGWLGTNGLNPMRFATNSSERMRIDSSGNLLVGTTNSSGTLTVAGTISCSSGFASDVTLTDTTATTYTAGTYYTLPGGVTVPLGNTYLVSILFTYDNYTYHNWCGGGIIGLTLWQAGGTNTTWTIPMDTHVDGAQTITIKANSSHTSRTLAWTPSVTKTVTTGGSIVVRLKLISTF